MYVPMNEYHFNRYFIERKTFLSLCKQLEDVQGQLRKLQEHNNNLPTNLNIISNLDISEKNIWNTICDYLKCNTENDCIERYRQEDDDYQTTISDWKKFGSAVFQFNENLAEMLFNTEVTNIPVTAFRCPYKVIYIYTGNIILFPEIDSRYFIDGMYIISDYYEDELLNFLKNAKEHYKWIIELSPEQRKIYEKREKEMGQYGLNIHDFLDINKAIKNIQETENKLNKFRTNIEHHDYSYINVNGNKSYDDYLNLYVIFTFRIKGKSVEELLPSEICNEPFLKAEYIFATYKSTVGEAIEQAYKHGSSKDTYIENSRSEESILNVINHPEYLNNVSKLVFNLLCYLSWKDRDVIIRYPNKKLQDKIDNSKTGKERQRNISKAESQGYRKIHFCGFQTKYPQEVLNSSNNIIIKSHWRRGHWRNQAFGPKLCNHKLLWIHPTIVNVDKFTNLPIETTLYSVLK